MPRPDRIRPINHRGDFYRVAGPLNMPRCPQGRPVLVQAGSSDTGRRFAARHADAVFTAHMAKATAQEFYADLKALAAAEGRAPDQVLILPGLSPMIGSTEAEAQRLVREVNDLCDPEVGRKRLSGRFGGHDFSHLPLDRPLAPEDFPDPGSVEAARSRTEVILNLVRRDRPTLRQLLGYLAGARGHFTTAGTPEQIADLIEDWFTDGAADGFNIMPPLLPAQLDVFSAEVIPLLQRRGLFRTEYAGTTLREHYGLAWPKSAFEEPLHSGGGDMTEPHGPLQGVKVVACSTAQAGTVPYMLMADLGAEVIKIEVPEIGDNSRGSTVLPGMPSTYFETNNRGVKSVTLNLKTAGGSRDPPQAGRQGRHLWAEFPARRGREERLRI